MATFGGFIASALGGAAKGYGEGAQMEMKKQAELDLKKQLMEAELEKASRLDDIKRQRDVTYARAETAYNQNPDTIAAVVKADVDKVKALIRSGLTTEEANLAVQKGKAAAGVQTDLLSVTEKLAKDVAASANRVTEANAPGAAAAASAVTLAGAQADAKVAPQLVEAFTQKYKASQDFEKLKAKDLSAAKAEELKALVADTEYMKALKTQNSVLHAHLVEIANINAAKDIKVAETRAASFDERTDAQIEKAKLDRIEKARKTSEGGGTPNVGLELERAEKSAEKALARALGVEVKEANGAYIALKRRADGGDAAAKAKLAEVTPMKNRLEAASAEWEARKKATAAAPAAAASGAAASSFTPAMPPGFKGAAPPPPSKFKLD